MLFVVLVVCYCSWLLFVAIGGCGWCVSLFVVCFPHVCALLLVVVVSCWRSLFVDGWCC